MKRTVLAAALALVAGGALADHREHPREASGTKSASLMKGLGDHHHPISTKSKEAQKFFDQGLTLVYAFNHDEAIRAFRRAAELDPGAAMPLWGIAYALGPNYNLPIDWEREQAAFAALGQARALAAGAPENERAYVDALAKRYTNDRTADLKQLDRDFALAMGELAEKHPDDLDAATLHAESLMNLNPWNLWTADGKPTEHTEEIVATLEAVLRRSPNHPGANHYYIHAVEASPNPERAIPSAKRLEALVPAAGHLVHMPSHVYMRTGDYAGAAESNAVAAEVDRAYIEKNEVEGVYPLMYYNHNVHFLAAAEAMRGNYAGAKKAADRVVRNAMPIAKEMPMIEFVLPTATIVDHRFRRWKEVLAAAEPKEAPPTTRALWRFTRAAALLATGKEEEATKERGAFEEIAKTVPDDTIYGLNPAKKVLAVARAELDARFADAAEKPDDAIAAWKRAVAAQDELVYNEPADWLYSERESLGGALLRAGKADEAETVFRADLEKNPRNPRSLFGLAKSLEAQQKAMAARSVEHEFRVAWKGADTKLRVEDL